MKLKKNILAALFVSLSFIGSNFKIFGTIAFDSFPAFLGTLLLGPIYGSIIGFLGHIFTSFLAGFPFGILVHFLISLTLAMTMIAFYFTYEFLKCRISKYLNLIFTGIIGTIFNGPVALAIIYPFLVPILGKAGVFSFLPILVIGSVANITFAILIFNMVEKVWDKYYEGL